MTQQTQRINPRLVAIVGALIVLSGVLFNPWSLAHLFSSSHHIGATWKLSAIYTAQAMAILVGVVVMWRGARMRLPAVALRSLSALLLAGLAVASYGNLRALKIINPDAALEEAWAELVAAEEVLLGLTSTFSRLSASMDNLTLPDGASVGLFAPTVAWNDLDASGKPKPYHEMPELGIDTRKWPVEGEPRQSSPGELSMWRSLLDDVAYFEHAKFYPIRGDFLDAAHTEYETPAGFKGLARLKSGEWYGIKAQLRLQLRRDPESGYELTDADAWQFTSWQLEEFKTTKTATMLFAESLDAAVRDPDALAEARRSQHNELLIAMARGTADAPDEFFTPASWDRHPAVAVADIDGDGFDDFYVMARRGKNQLFRNNGNGTFDEIAAASGLDVDGNTNAAIFADFDNDGDLDAILGRSLEPSMYLRNDGGRFVPAPDAIDGRLPALVSSVSVTDYNGDGLLDAYLSTYSAGVIQRNPDRIKDFLAADDVEKLRLESEEAHKYLRRPGPPNVLLKNLGGGRLAVTDEAPELRVFRNTYQSTWGDYDADGDQDVYIANDFSPNFLFRNDGGGKFVDVTAATGTADIGFGMGASWGDYDGDGQQDLYVSNMFSKAGRRITARLGGLDPRFAQMAQGNTLFRNQGGKFTKVSGTEKPAMLVEAAGWSWGSQLVDLDNDGALDAYALSGYHTQPEEKVVRDG